MQSYIKTPYAIALSLMLLFSSVGLSAEYYGQPGEFLRYSPSARALAMGRAYTAIGQDANALHWNPGALSQLQRTGLSLVGTQASLFGLANYSSLSVGVPFEIIDAPFFQKLGNLTVGMSFLNLTSDITGADHFGNLDQSSSLSTSQGAFSFAVASSNNIKYLKDFSVGVGADIIWNNLFGYKKTSAGLNAGIYYHNENIETLNWFTFAFAFKNINEPNISVDAQIDENVPATGKLGVAFMPPFCSTLPHFIRPLIVSFDYDLLTADGQDKGLYLGVEYNVSRLQSYLPIRLRLGTNTKESAFTFGLSLDLPANPFMTKGLEYLPSLDYSFNFYGDNDYLGDVKQGAISFAWSPKTPADWYFEGMQHYPLSLLSPLNNNNVIIVASEKFHRVFDNPQALANPNYSIYGYNALLRMGDLQIASAWLANDKNGLLENALKSYRKAGTCVSIDADAKIEKLDSVSLLYRLQAEIKRGTPTESLFSQPFVAMIEDQERVQFLRGFSYYTSGNVSEALNEWRELELPIAKYYRAKAENNAEALKSLAFSDQTKISETQLYPFFPDFDIADNALYDYAEIVDLDEWKLLILKLFPLTELHQEIIQSIKKGR